jgi:hypothetical protein
MLRTSGSLFNVKMADKKNTFLLNQSYERLSPPMGKSAVFLNVLAFEGKKHCSHGEIIRKKSSLHQMSIIHTSNCNVNRLWKKLF